MSKNKNKAKNYRLGTVGGQAVMEGVMMKSRSDMAVAVRNDKGRIVVRTKKVKSAKDKCKILGWPILRGIVNFAEMLILSYSTLTASMEMAGMDKIDTESKFDKWIDKHFGKHILAIVGVLGAVLGVGLMVLLFMFLPMWIANLINGDSNRLGWAYSLVEGAVKITLFITYLVLVSLMPDIKRLFRYHGAEHKSIFCYEKGLELTVENVQKQKRFHPRCGTSFIFVLLALSIIAGSFIPHDIGAWRVLLKLAVILPIVGIGYEFIRYAGKHENIVTRVLSAPGLWMQRITTKEPDDTMVEVAIVSVKSALHNEFPDFEIPFEEKAEEKPEENPEENPETEENKTGSESVNDDDR
ncbi:MAG: DUF1385 domain-containing protein [Clostridia bacterium]|nr:DUF1385 domain-containing protein [Clostridia bacterium]